MRIKAGVFLLAAVVMAANSAWAQSITGTSSDAVGDTFVTRKTDGSITASSFITTGAGSSTIPHIVGLIDINATGDTGTEFSREVKQR